MAIKSLLLRDYKLFLGAAVDPLLQMKAKLSFVHYARFGRVLQITASSENDEKCLQ